MIIGYDSLVALWIQGGLDNPTISHVFPQNRHADSTSWKIPYESIPVEPHEAVAEVSRIGNV